MILAIVFVGVNLFVLGSTKGNMRKQAQALPRALVYYFPEQEGSPEQDHVLEQTQPLLQGGQIDTVYVFGTAKTVTLTEAYVKRHNPQVDLVTNTYGLSVYEVAYALGKTMKVEAVVVVDNENRLQRAVYDMKKFDMQVVGYPVERLKNLDVWGMLYEGWIALKDFCVVNVYKYEPQKLSGATG